MEITLGPMKISCDVQNTKVHIGGDSITMTKDALGDYIVVAPTSSTLLSFQVGSVYPELQGEEIIRALLLGYWALQLQGQMSKQGSDNNEE